jgi:hypothetical protein
VLGVALALALAIGLTLTVVALAVVARGAALDATVAIAVVGTIVAEVVAVAPVAPVVGAIVGVTVGGGFVAEDELIPRLHALRKSAMKSAHVIGIVRVRIGDMGPFSFGRDVECRSHGNYSTIHAERSPRYPLQGGENRWIERNPDKGQSLWGNHSHPG